VASRPALVLGLALLAALAACGSDDDRGDGREMRTTERAGTKRAEQVPTGPVKGKVQTADASLPPEAQVDLAIKRVLASGIPGLACDRHATERYVRTAFGDRAGCRRSTVPASAASSVRVSAIRISGDDARAVAVPTGGPSGGERIRIELIRAGGVWKIDSLRSNAPVGP
jgi:hypothetical protein